MRVLITGSNGQLGKEITEKMGKTMSIKAYGKDQLDITNELQVSKIVNHMKPDVIIHTAAYTSVDQCEFAQKQAFEVNSLGAFYVAKAAQNVGAKMVCISTDYVFSGDKNKPYVEGDIPNPKSVYGISKWMGEKLVQATLKECYIVRTSWLYGGGGNNFVKTMLKLAKQKREIKVVDDQVGSPTYTKDLAEVIIQLIGKSYGIYHVSNSGSCSWYEFAKHILKQAGFDANMIKSITTASYGAPAPRPAYSVMAHDALQRESIPLPRCWEEAVNDFLREELKDD
ncbi:dTDP-4-dehydrorhamnose reductase [Alkalihalobacterium elongatum]|uniref:dTDP-4-dehydrorhamnose reductase n=1 Tax=Alkalihalobacterium elongatum TaxID=2675466 RepID=UPI001C1F5F8B|nr:dTDP-4-dehydrorhamnose reductase [Alkalihalobacterium elongatum]